MLVPFFLKPYNPILLNIENTFNFADFAKISKRLHDKKYKRKKRGGR